MSQRQWQEGDLAIVTTRSGREYRAIYTLATGIDYFWRPLDMETGTGLTDPDVSARPLVTIDPESREDAFRLINLYFGGRADDKNAAVMQAALREYADPKPPKPEEPTGLGAVVEDAEAKQWIRLHTHQGDCNDWYPVRGAGYDEPEIRSRENGGMRRSWSELDVVRVLSEGVQS